MVKSIRWPLIISVFLFSSTLAFSQSSPDLPPGYYVTVAAYAKGKTAYAQRYTSNLVGKGLTAAYGYDSTRRLHFVYLEYFKDLKASIKRMQAVRQEGYPEAWVRVIPGYITGPPAAASTTSSTPKEATSQSIKSDIPATSTTPAGTVAQTASSTQEQSTEGPGTSVATEPSTQVESPADSAVEEPQEKLVQHNPMTLGNTEIFFSLFNATNERIIDGEVQVVDADRNKLVKTVKGNEYMIMPDPKNQTGQVLLVAEVFGYRKAQVELNFKEPLRDTAQQYFDLMGTTFVVYFDMIRYRRGDIATLYHVYFFNDAAVMLPSSQYELNNLRQMMQENPRYRIRLHGHTNGNYHGKIITMGANKNFFALEGSTQTIGTAKTLSFQRAEAIKEYLVANGVDASRVEVKAWGGKRPIYDKHGANARKNVRVEVEVIQE
jgi:outer membrane protein OmpA-like peptidoglycan-associated protein